MLPSLRIEPERRRVRAESIARKPAARGDTKRTGAWRRVDGVRVMLDRGIAKAA